MSSLFTSTQHVFSGMCVCGHRVYAHHGHCIAKREVSEAMKSGTWYSECEALGHNELWEPCPTCPKGFVDVDDPLKAEKLAE